MAMLPYMDVIGEHFIRFWGRRNYPQDRGTRPPGPGGARCSVALAGAGQAPQDGIGQGRWGYLGNDTHSYQARPFDRSWLREDGTSVGVVRAIDRCRTTSSDREPADRDDCFQPQGCSMCANNFVALLIPIENNCRWYSTPSRNRTGGSRVCSKVAKRKREASV